MIDNLLSNAVKFTIEGTILTTLKEEDQQVGYGTDPDILPKLFSKFATKSYH